MEIKRLLLVLQTLAKGNLNGAAARPIHAKALNAYLIRQVTATEMAPDARS